MPSLLSFISCWQELIFSYYVLEKKVKVKSKGKRTIHFTSLQLLSRGFLSGSLITFAVILAKLGGPLLEGLLLQNFPQEL